MENVQQVNENDQITKDALTSVSDEILRKKKKKRKISLAVISAVVLVLAIAIITLACIKINLKPYFIESPSRYILVLEGNTVGNYIEGDDNYEEFDELLNRSFTQSILTALFNGQLGSYEIDEGSVSQTFYSSSESQSGMSSYLSSSVGNSYIHLHYGVEQRLYNSDQSLYYSHIYTSRYEMKYVDVYIPVSESGESVTIYFGTYGDHVQSAYISSITIKASTAQLFDYLSQL